MIFQLDIVTLTTIFEGFVKIAINSHWKIFRPVRICKNLVINAY